MSTEAAPLRALLAIPEVARTLGSSLLARLPFTSIGLLLILQVRAAGGSWAQGGVAAGAFAFGIAAVGPFLARLTDRRGQRAVLVPCAVVSAGALLAVALLPGSAPVAAIVGLGALAGVAHPPVSGATRALWPDIVPSDRRHAVLAIEAVGVELTFIAGPLLIVGAFASLTSPATGLVVCAVCLVAGTLAFTATPSSARMRPSGRGGSLGGALGSGALVCLVGAALAMGASFGAIEVATTAHADEHGHPGLVGVLLATWAAGSLVGGLLTARSRAPADPHRRLVLMLAATACADALAAAAPGPWFLGPALFLAGTCIAPAFATLYGMVADVAPPGTLTESYTWVSTGITAGMAGGAALAGVLVDGVSTHAAIAGAAGAVVIATLIVVAGGGRWRRGWRRHGRRPDRRDGAHRREPLGDDGGALLLAAQPLRVAARLARPAAVEPGHLRDDDAVPFLRDGGDHRHVLGARRRDPATGGPEGVRAQHQAGAVDREAAALGEVGTERPGRDPPRRQVGRERAALPSRQEVVGPPRRPPHRGVRERGHDEDQRVRQQDVVVVEQLDDRPAGAPQGEVARGRRAEGGAVALVAHPREAGEAVGQQRVGAVLLDEPLHRPPLGDPQPRDAVPRRGEVGARRRVQGGDDGDQPVHRSVGPPGR